MKQKRVTKKSRMLQTIFGLMAIIIFLALLITKNGGTTMNNNDNNIVTINTSKGAIVVVLYPDKAPLTVKNFQQYMQEGFYNNTIFHRVIDGFMIQGGGFTPNGLQKRTNPPIILEAGMSNERGTIAMARTNDPNSATSQFFINLVNNSFLNPSASNPGYAVFGKVISGMDIVDAIAKVQTKNSPQPNWPVEDIRITSVTSGGQANV